jgi:PAS domain S-box-containing protein
VEPTPIFDWRAMQRFGLESRDLPPGSIVRHRPPSLWEAYRNEVLITAAAFVFLTLLVAALSLNILRRRRVEARLEQARDALRASHAHLEERVRERTRELAEMKTLLDSAERIGSSGSWQWHLDTDAFTVSRNWLDLHGVEGGALSREELLRLAHPEDASRVVRAFNEALESGRPYELTHRIIRADTGEVRTIQARGEVVRDEAGRATGILGWAQDVTRIKAAEDALRAANRELEAFSYSVSHDLRAPLHSVSGFSSMLQETQQTRLDDEGRDLLRRIVAATGHMDRLIDDILRLSRISRADMRKEPVDVSALAEEVVRGLAEREPGRAVRARVQPGVVAAADRELLRVLLENLLGNAWKYTRDVAEPDVALEAQSLDGETVYTVCDNGAGFDMNYAHKLFAPFQRLHSDSEFQGTGIGLALVQRIVQRHGGRIWAESGPGRGAAFHFTLG